MKTNPRIDEEVEKTLRSLEGIQRATPQPFFLTRVQARLERGIAPKPTPAWAFRPAYLAASLGLVLLLNVSTVVYVWERMAQHEREEDAAGFSVEWGLESNPLDW
ncbi:MAG: hypothetical protein H7Z75_15400 [Ferruginibacter sp.]|nr:hypothetical protein [Cytophagales bacterium]